MKKGLAKIMGSFLIANALIFQVHAQNAHEISIEMNKVNTTAFQAEYQNPKDLMELTILEKFKKAGITKGKSNKGFTKYEGVVLAELSPNKIDIYFKTEGKGNLASIVMLVSTGYDNFVSTANEATIAGNTISFLNRLAEDAILMKKMIDVSNQEKMVKEAEEKLKKSESEKEKIGKKMATLQKELESANQEQDKASKQLEAEKIRLDNLKALVPQQ